MTLLGGNVDLVNVAAVNGCKAIVARGHGCDRATRAMTVATHGFRRPRTDEMADKLGFPWTHCIGHGRGLWPERRDCHGARTPINRKSMDTAMPTIKDKSVGPAPNKEDVMSALRSVIDPELGVNIVDLGLVQDIVCGASGVRVALIMTTPACPLGEMIVEQAEQALVSRFPAAEPVEVELLRGVVWSPERLSGEGRRQLGLSP